MSVVYRHTYIHTYTHIYLFGQQSHSFHFDSGKQTLVGEMGTSDLAALFFMHSTRVLGPRGDKR